MWESIFAWLAVGAGLVAAGLWLRACFVRVDYKPHVDANGWTSAAVTLVGDDGRQIDPFATAARGSFWNAWAAGVTAGAVLLQAASLAAYRLGA